MLRQAKKGLQVSRSGFGQVKTLLGVLNLPLLPRVDVPSPPDVIDHILAWPRDVVPDVQLFLREYGPSLTGPWRRQGEDEENRWHGASAPFEDDVPAPGH